MGAVLVVDDNPSVRKCLARCVAVAGPLVFTASDGSEALRLLGRDEIPRPCLILVDWAMHPMSGQEFLNALRCRPDADQLPALIVSGEAWLPAIATLPGILGTLRKPVDLDEFLAVITSSC